jgi:pyridoxal/pyridoxine/pyridoxamine kinase
MIRFVITLAIIGVLVFLGSTVQLGNKTFFGHVRAIWHTEEVQDLKNGVEDKAGPALDRVKRGVKAGYAAATGGDDGSGSGSGSATIDGGFARDPMSP